MGKKERRKTVRRIGFDQVAAGKTNARLPEHQTEAAASADHNPSRWICPQHAVAAVLFLSTIAVYWPVRHHQYNSIDDPLYVSANPMVAKGLTAEGLRWATTTMHAANWHPLTWVSHMADVQLFGLAPGGHHLVSVFLHALSAALLFLVLRAMTGSVGRSAAVAALFSLHPLRVESVAWIAERKDVLCGFFWILTLAAYLRWVRLPCRRRSYLAALAAFALGLISKPMIITLPFVLLLLDFWPLGRLRFPALGGDGTRSLSGLRFSRRLIEKAPFLSLSIASGVITIVAQQAGGAVGTIAHYPASLRVANAIVAYARYIFMTLWPQDLMMLYPYPEQGPAATAILSSGALVAALTCLSVWVAASRPYLAVGWFWYLGTLVPVIGLVQVGLQSMADRYTYIPHIGLFIASLWGVHGLMMRLPARWRISVAVCLVAVLVPLGLRTRTQLGVWRTNRDLFQNAVRIHPNDWVMQTELGLILAEEGHVLEGIEHYYASLRANPKYVKTYFNLGVVLNSLGRVGEAVESYQTALRLSPSFAEAHFNLGLILEEKGQLADASMHFAKAVQSKPDYADAYHSLGAVQYQLGKTGEAARYLERAQQLQPWNTQIRADLARVRGESPGAHRGNTRKP